MHPRHNNPNQYLRQRKNLQQLQRLPIPPNNNKLHRHNNILTKANIPMSPTMCHRPPIKYIKYTNIKCRLPSPTRQQRPRPRPSLTNTKQMYYPRKRQYNTNRSNLQTIPIMSRKCPPRHDHRLSNSRHSRHISIPPTNKPTKRFLYNRPTPPFTIHTK